jgi:hypothetical protein
MIEYFNPYNEKILIKKSQDLRKILNESINYWTLGNGASSVEVNNSSLIFFKIKEGFFIEHLPSATAPNINPKEETRVLTHYVGGEPMDIPSNCLANEKTAYKILTYFIENDGTLLQEFDWIDIFDLIHDRYGE